jgi:serine/threonine protein kinase
MRRNTRHRMPKPKRDFPKTVKVTRGGYLLDGAVYKKAEILGQGSYGVVRRLVASDDPVGFAIKTLHPVREAPTEHERRLRRANMKQELAEARRGLLTPALVVSKTNEIVMPVGKDLGDYLMEGELHPEEAHRIAREIYKQQQKLIDMGLVYTDVKTENILVLPDGPDTDDEDDIVLSDYGGLCRIGADGKCINTIGLPQKKYNPEITIKTRAEAEQAAKYYTSALMMQMMLADKTKQKGMPVALGHSGIGISSEARQETNRYFVDMLTQHGFDEEARWLHQPPSHYIKKENKYD